MSDPLICALCGEEIPKGLEKRCPVLPTSEQEPFVHEVCQGKFLRNFSGTPVVVHKRVLKSK
jgi:hypothetical protein